LDISTPPSTLGQLGWLISRWQTSSASPFSSQIKSQQHGKTTKNAINYATETIGEQRKYCNDRRAAKILKRWRTIVGDPLAQMMGINSTIGKLKRR